MYITDVFGYVCVIFSNIVLYSIPLAESKNDKPKISNAPADFELHILEVIWMTLTKTNTLKNWRASFLIKLQV